MGRRRLTITNGRYRGNYLTEDDCRRLEQVIRMSKDGKSYIEDLQDVIYELSDSEINSVLFHQSSDYINPSKGSLTNFQTLGVAYMYFASRCILGDSVGLGKTVEVAGLFNLLKHIYNKNGHSFRFLFLTRKALVQPTQRKLIRFTGEYCFPLMGEKDKVNKWYDENSEELQSNVVGVHSLLKNSLFHAYLQMYVSEYGYNPFDILVIDESGDVLSNSTSQYYKEASALVEYFDKVILLNATPFEGNLMAFYNQLNFLDNTLLPTKTAFTKDYVVMDYTGPYPKPSGKYRNADKFRQLVGYRYLQRTRKGLGATIKDCTADVIVSELSPLQKSLLKRTEMPQMVRDCPSYFGQGIKTDLNTTPKLRSLVDLLNGELKEVPSILVYTRYKESQAVVSSVLNEMGISHLIMNGDTSDEDREIIINRFQLKDTRVLITNVQKGLDFGQCNHCIFYTYDSSPNIMVQFEGRMTRSIDIINKHVYLLVSRGAELNTLKNEISQKAIASDLFAGSDFSCVLSLLLDEERLKSIK